MSAQLIDGRKIAHRLKEVVTGELALLPSPAGLAVVRVGDDFASLLYRRRLARVAADLGVRCQVVELPGTTSQSDLIDAVTRLNSDPLTNGILLLRPLPTGIDEAAVFARIAPLKDIEAVHPENAGLLSLGRPRYVPSTAASVFHLLDAWLDECGEDRAEFYHRSRIVVVGRSNNVGKPAISLAYGRQAAVTSIDEWACRHRQLGSFTRRAEVLVVATGVPGLIRAEHVRPGAVVIDVGINPVRSPDTGATLIVGDVDFEQVRSRARAITPVPGGVGPVTDVWLLRNTAEAARLQSEE